VTSREGRVDDGVDPRLTLESFGPCRFQPRTRVRVNTI
jgi:hypothetical protein